MQHDNIAVETLYVGYELLSLLSGIYAKAMEHDYQEERKKHWAANLESTLQDIEVCFGVWQINNDELEYGLPVKLPAPLTAVSHKLRKHLVRIDRCVHPWVILRRLPKVLLACEERLITTLSQLANELSLDQKDFLGMSEAGGRRVNALQKLSEHFAGESRSLQL